MARKETRKIQNKIYGNNVKDMRTIADSIAYNAKRIYKFKSEGMIRDTYLNRVNYVNVSNSTDKITVVFSKRMRGFNKALEIEGTPEYVFSKAFGKYLDLFPFWKHYINPNADKEKILTNSDFIKLNGKRFYLQTQYEYWIISMN